MVQGRVCMGGGNGGRAAASRPVYESHVQDCRQPQAEALDTATVVIIKGKFGSFYLTFGCTADSF